MADHQGTSKPHQANVALTERERQVLDALVFVEDASRSEVLRPVVSNFLAEQAEDHHVKTAMEARRKRHAEKKAGPKVSKLADKRRTPGRSGA